MGFWWDKGRPLPPCDVTKKELLKCKQSHRGQRLLVKNGGWGGDILLTPERARARAHTHDDMVMVVILAKKVLTSCYTTLPHPPTHKNRTNEHSEFQQ